MAVAINHFSQREGEEKLSLSRAQLSLRIRRVSHGSAPTPMCHAPFRSSGMSTIQMMGAQCVIAWGAWHGLTVIEINTHHFFFWAIKKQHEGVRKSRQRGKRGRCDSGFAWAAGQLSLLLAGRGGTGREAACTDSVIWQAATAGAAQGVFGAAVIRWPQIAPASYSLHLPAATSTASSPATCDYYHQFSVPQRD